MQHSWKTQVHAKAWDIIYSTTEANSTHATSSGRFLNTPYPLEAFGDLLHELDLYDEKHGDHYANIFLDVGCGNGQLMAIAGEYFGYHTYGFDMDRFLINEAWDMFEKLETPETDAFPYVWTDDVERFGDFHPYDIVALNRLYVGPGQQSELEAKVWGGLRSGSYMVKLNNVTVPDGAVKIAENKFGGMVVRKPLA